MTSPHTRPGPAPVRHPFPHCAAHLFVDDQRERIETCKATVQALPVPLAVELPRPPVDARGAPVHDQGTLAAFVDALETAVSLCRRHHGALEQLGRLRSLVRDASHVNPVGMSGVGIELRRVTDALPTRADHPSDAAWIEALEHHVATEDAALRERIAGGYRAHLLASAS